MLVQSKFGGDRSVDPYKILTVMIEMPVCKLPVIITAVQTHKSCIVNRQVNVGITICFFRELLEPQIKMFRNSEIRMI